MGGTGIRGHKRDKNPQLVEDDSRSEVMEQNHGRGKEEQGIITGTKEDVK